MNINLEPKNAGLFANLYYCNEKTGELQFIWADDIDQYGMANLVFTHASDYVIVIDKEIMNSNATSPKTNDDSGRMLVGLLMLMLISLGTGSYLMIKRYSVKRGLK